MMLTHSSVRRALGRPISPTYTCHIIDSNSVPSASRSACTVLYSAAAADCEDSSLASAVFSACEESALVILPQASYTVHEFAYIALAVSFYFHAPARDVVVPPGWCYIVPADTFVLEFSS